VARESALGRLPLAAKAGIILLWAALVGAVYFVVFYGDLASSIQAAQAQERKLHGQLADARKAEFAYQKDLTDLKEREQRQSEINKILPKESQYASFLSNVQSVASVSGVNLRAWTPQEERSEQYYARVPMKLVLSGRYHQVAKFFYGVGQLDRIINMEDISITEPQQENDEVRLQIEVLATAFRSVPQEKQQSVEQPGSKGDRSKRMRAAKSGKHGGKQK
jgi:type IV pilus assembly protein PilO